MSQASVHRDPLPEGAGARRILFVFNWLVVGGEETEVRLLARHLDPSRYRIEVVACFRKPNMPAQTHAQLEQLGVAVDRTPYSLSFEDTVDYLARKVAAYDLVVSCQAPPDLYPALERAWMPPPLIEHGGLVSEATAGPKHLTSRYVGVCAQIRDAAAAAMPARPHHALEIPSMVDLTEFDPADRPATRREWGLDKAAPVIGWVGRLDRKKRVEDVIRAAQILRERHPAACFLLIGGPDAFMPEYADELRGLTRELGLERVVRFLGDRPDVPRLLSGLDILVWLARGEGMPHVIAEAGAARLPVVATRDGGTEEQIEDGVSGLFVPHERPEAVAAALDRLIGDADLRRRLGDTLRRKVEQEYSAAVVTRRWQALFDEVIAEGPR
ncbi:MAG: glycosyltransferase family 4 protein [Chloroflexi bacterium]|nr:glycosyltransferase family 4 protein [Chloroflexota bacterium]